MSKKILSVALALIFVISTFAVSAFAVGGAAFEEDAEAYTQAWRLEDLGETDGTYSVGVYLETNYNVGAIQFQIANDDGNAVLEGVDSDVFAAPDFDVQWTEDGLVFIVPTPADWSAEAVDATTEILVATLSYTLKAGASSATLAIVDDAKSEANPGGSLIAVRITEDNLVTGTMIYGQTATVEEGITIGAAAKPELVLKNGVTVNTGYCNTAYTGVIFGFTAFGSEANYRKSVTSTLGDDYIVYEANADGKNGTGAVIKLVDTDGTVLESYAVVVFGDPNGDGRVTTTDITYLVTNRTNLAKSTGADKLAANVDGDARHAVTTNDITYLVQNRTSMTSLQQTIAATY